MNRVRFSLLVLVMTTLATYGSIYQWSTAVPGVVSDETGLPPKAYLWISPDCQRLRAVVVGQHNMEEEPILEHPVFRQTLADLDMAAIWVTPAWSGQFDFVHGVGEQFTAMMAALAEVSGYDELRTVPVVPIGHSAMAGYPWNFAAWNPGRTLAAVSVSGQMPYWQDQVLPDPAHGSHALDGVPGIVCMGEYEWAEQNTSRALDARAQHPGLPLSVLAEPGGGHFDLSDRKLAFLAFYLRKAAQYRLPDQLGEPLRPIDPTTTGWLVDRWHRDQGPEFPAAPVGSYTGDPTKALWCFDEEHARTIEEFQAYQRGLQPQLAGFIQDGKVVAQTPGTHQQVNLRFLPIGDGLTFRLQGTPIDTVPAGRPERWTGRKAGEGIAHATTGKVAIHRITGPVVQTGPDTWAIRFNRVGFDNPRRSNDVWFFAEHPGDASFRRIAQQAQMRFPLCNTVGKPQRIEFPSIPHQPAGTKRVSLRATSTASLPVYYYVESGPAEIVGEDLVFTAIPPRAKFPLKVSVVAWQWGRSIEPQVATAEPVRREFYLYRGEMPPPIPLPRQELVNLEARFNEPDPDVALVNGAMLGAPGSGVSGQPGDRAYVAVPDPEQPEQGPVAQLRHRPSVQGLDAFTLTLWWRAGANQRVPFCLFDLTGALLIGEPNGLTFRHGAQVERNVRYWFPLGNKGPLGEWLQPDRWVFAAFVWDRTANTFQVYQGTKDHPVEACAVAQRNEPVGSLAGRADDRPDAIGNTLATTYQRPFNGSLDNLRILTRALDAQAIEAIRQADLANLPPQIP